MTTADNVNSNASTEAGAVAKLAELAEAAVPAGIETTSDGRAFILHRQDFKVQEITPLNGADVLKPKIVEAGVVVHTVDSLVDYVNRFKNAETVLFADIKMSTVIAMIDYHKAPPTNVGHPGTVEGVGVTLDQPSPMLCKHRVTLSLPHSEEWNLWIKGQHPLMSHKAFAAFLEEHAEDIKSPPGSQLLELCRDLQMVNNVKFTSTVRHGDYNTVSFQKENDAAAKGEIGLPNEFLIEIPIYFGEADVQMRAFLRKRVDDEGLHLGYQLHQVEQTRQKEFHRIVDDVMARVDLTTLYGAPGR